LVLEDVRPALAEAESAAVPMPSGDAPRPEPGALVVSNGAGGKGSQPAAIAAQPDPLL